MSESERSQGERGARRAGRLAAPRAGAGIGRAPAGLSEERAERESERSQGERGARRAGRLAAPRAGAGIGRAPAGLSEERA
jgi:hypothetical protein